MTKITVEGMKARSKGQEFSTNPYSGEMKVQWAEGWTIVDQHVFQVINNAESMLADIQKMKSERKSQQFYTRQSA